MLQGLIRFALPILRYISPSASGTEYIQTGSLEKRGPTDYPMLMAQLTHKNPYGRLWQGCWYRLV